MRRGAHRNPSRYLRSLISPLAASLPSCRTGQGSNQWIELPLLSSTASCFPPTSGNPFFIGAGLDGGTFRLSLIVLVSYPVIQLRSWGFSSFGPERSQVCCHPPVFSPPAAKALSWASWNWAWSGNRACSVYPVNFASHKLPRAVTTRQGESVYSQLTSPSSSSFSASTMDAGGTAGYRHIRSGEGLHPEPSAICCFRSRMSQDEPLGAHPVEMKLIIQQPIENTIVQREIALR